MQDVKAKREARRRRILENSEKRLQKISQLKYGDNEIIPDHLISVSLSDAKNSSNYVVNNYDADYSENTYHADFASSDDRDYHAGSPVRNSHDILQSGPSLGCAANKNSSPKIWKKLGFKLVILAIIVRIVHIFRLGYLFGETVVIPFSLFMMTQLGSCQFDQNIAGITGPVLLFFGVSPNKIKNLLICYNVVTSILIYFGIYFFTFVLVHLICVIIFGL